MPTNSKLFSDRMNDETFRIYIPEYYQPTLPDYFKQHRNSGYAVVNGQIVSDEEYQAHTGEPVLRDDFIPQPIYIADELNMCISSCPPAMIIDMDINQVPFRFQNIEDIPKVCDIMDGYQQEMYPYASRSVELKQYLDQTRSTCAKLKSAYEEMKHDEAVRHNKQPKNSNSLLDLLKMMR